MPGATVWKTRESRIAMQVATVVMDVPHSASASASPAATALHLTWETFSHTKDLRWA